MTRCKDITGSGVFPFFYFSIFFLKKNERRQGEWHFFHWCQEQVATLFFLRNKLKTPGGIFAEMRQ
jgi:hypothetical protein